MTTQDLERETDRAHKDGEHVRSRRSWFAAIDKEGLRMTSEAVKSTGVVAVGLGFVYLIAYCLREGLPMPLSLSELPTLLLAVAVLATGLWIIAVGFVVFPMLGSAGLLGPAWNLFSDKLLSKGKKVRFWRSYLCIGGPIGLAVIGLIAGRAGREWIWAWATGILVFVGLMAVIIFNYLFNNKTKGVQRLMTGQLLDALLPVTVFGFVWSLIGTAIPVVSIVRAFAIVAPWAVVTVTVVMTLLVTTVFTVLVTSRANESDRVAAGKVGALVGVLVMCVSMLIWPGAGYFGGMALQFLNIGGGVEIGLVAKVTEGVPSELTNGRVRLLLLSGSDIWISKIEQNQTAASNVAFRLPRESVTSMDFSRTASAGQKN